MHSLVYNSKNIFHYPCPLIDLNTRTCLQSIDDCNDGIIINKIFCHFCDCSKTNENDLICDNKCSCKKLFYQSMDPYVKVELTENYVVQDEGLD